MCAPSAEAEERGARPGPQWPPTRPRGLEQEDRATRHRVRGERGGASGRSPASSPSWGGPGAGAHSHWPTGELGVALSASPLVCAVAGRAPAASPLAGSERGRCPGPSNSARLEGTRSVAGKPWRPGAAGVCLCTTFTAYAPKEAMAPPGCPQLAGT